MPLRLDHERFTHLVELNDEPLLAIGLNITSTANLMLLFVHEDNQDTKQKLQGESMTSPRPFGIRDVYLSQRHPVRSYRIPLPLQNPRQKITDTLQQLEQGNLVCPEKAQILLRSFSDIAPAVPNGEHLRELSGPVPA